MLIEIDVDSLLPPQELSKFRPEVLVEIAQTLAELARAKWIQLAGEKLHKTSQDYIRAIQEVKTENQISSVVLAGAFPNMLEHGFAPFDMRDTLLGPNAHSKRVSKDGNYYRSIFFRVMGPTATGRNAQKVTDKYAQFLGAGRAEKIGKAAWNAMRRLEPSLSNPGGKTQWGGRLPEGAVTDTRGRSHAFAQSGLDIAGTSTGGKVLKEGDFIRHGGPEHKTDLFAGAVKMKQGKSTFYGTFRTISTATTEGWIHPGFAVGVNLAPEAAKFATSQIPMLMQTLNYTGGKL